MKKIIFFQFAIFCLLPGVAFAQVTDVDSLGLWLMDFFNQLYYLLLALALVLFIWGLARFLLNIGDVGDKSKYDSTGARQRGKSLMIWGIASLFVVYTLWAIVSFIVYGSFDLVTDTPCYVDKYGNSLGGTDCATRG